MRLLPQRTMLQAAAHAECLVTRLTPISFSLPTPSPADGTVSPLQPGSTPAARRQRRSRTGRTVRAGPATDRAVTACFTAGAAVPHRRVMRSRATGTRPSICPRPCGVARLPRSDGRPGSPRPARDQPRAFRIKALDRRLGPVPKDKDAD